MKHRPLLVSLLGLGVAVGGGWLAFPYALYSRTEQPIQFSHRIHTGEKVGLSCKDCHAMGQEGRFSGIAGLEACTPCHTEVQGTSADEKKLVEEYVSKGREIPWLVYARQPENVYFSHAQHVKLAGLACERCHGPHGASDALRPFERNRVSGYSRDIWGRSISRLRRSEWEGMKMDDCSRCHRERGVRESCLDCHK